MHQYCLLKIFLSADFVILWRYFELNFSLLYYHKIDFRLFDDMIPWEKEIYINMMIQKVREEEESRKLKELERKAKSRSRR